MIKMNDREIKDLMTEIWKNCKLKESKNISMAWIYNTTNNDFSLFIEDSIIDNSSLNDIKEITKRHELETRWVFIGSQKGLEIFTLIAQ